MALQYCEQVARLAVGMEIAVDIDWYYGRVGESTVHHGRVVLDTVRSLEAVLRSEVSSGALKRHWGIVLEHVGDAL